MTTDEHWMERALILARKGLGLTTPNPPVGAVIVRDGHEIASGWHHAAGRPHAEREAISDAAARAVDIRGATIYVTLEPCSSHGRTGACTKALISAGLARVVYGSCDPKHAGAADAILHEKGIVVESGVRQKKCDWLIRGFSSVQERGRPWVILKSGMSLDGRLTRPPGESQWLTSLESREKVQLLRAEVDAILTSGETVRRDNPVLSLRSPAISPEKKQAWRVVFSKFKRGDFSNYQLCQDEFRGRTLFFTAENPSESLEILAREHDCQSVLLEAGGRLNAAFLEAGLVDELALFYAPMVTGGSVPALAGRGARSVSEAWGISNPECEAIGNDFFVRGALTTRKSAAKHISRG